MKMNKLAMVSAAFIFGAVSAVSLFALLSFTNASGSAPSSQAGSTITAAEANTLLKNYLKTADLPTKPIKGVFLDMQELNALNTLAGKNPRLSGFRVYFGKEADGTIVGMVVGVDGQYVDVASSDILKTSSPKTGPCPTVCDKTSPIGQD
jgi:hypothetical protein